LTDHDKKEPSKLDELAEETPEMLAAIDEGLRSIKEKGVRLVTREELQKKIRQWSGVSR
jgi:peptidoglycan/xylan/chitin deacetylase (PgdA/CDA1 family)